MQKASAEKFFGNRRKPYRKTSFLRHERFGWSNRKLRASPQVTQSVFLFVLPLEKINHFHVLQA